MEGHHHDGCASPGFHFSDSGFRFCSIRLISRSKSLSKTRCCRPKESGEALTTAAHALAYNKVMTWRNRISTDLAICHGRPVSLARA